MEQLLWIVLVVTPALLKRPLFTEVRREGYTEITRQFNAIIHLSS